MYFLKKTAIVLLGSMLLSFGINFFLVPFEVLDGGIIGIGLIIKYLTGLQAGLVIICLSVPIFVLAWLYNKNYFYNSLHGMLISSFVIDLLASSQLLPSDMILHPIVSSILGGIFIGVGIGIMLWYETSTGGTDLIAQFLSKLFNINVGMIIFVIDTVVISIGGWLISKDTFLLSILTVIFVGFFTSFCTWNYRTENG
ncbi:YitT family protein [Robertmurraya sp. FSL R5-0851]|uniref:YitT family protein n=1 Tax=Robertmurraya sp. FSL R5-0851 TaxID=2921584 RepID=UPI001D72DAFF